MSQPSGHKRRRASAAAAHGSHTGGGGGTAAAPDALHAYLKQARAAAEAQNAQLTPLLARADQLARDLAGASRCMQATRRHRTERRLQRIRAHIAYLRGNGPMRDFLRRARPFVEQHAALQYARDALLQDEKARRTARDGDAADAYAVTVPYGSAACSTAAAAAALTESDVLQSASETLVCMAQAAEHTTDRSGAAPRSRQAAAVHRSTHAPLIRLKDVCPTCEDHPVLVLDPVQAVLMCPVPSCTFARAFHDLTCPSLMHEERPASTRGASTPSAELFSAMQRSAGLENKPVPVEVLQMVMRELARMGVPATPDAVTYDTVHTALCNCRLSKYYDQRVQIRSRIMGISPPRFTADQRAKLQALHAVEMHLQPWVDPQNKCSNTATRLAFLCHRMGWWEHLPAPRILSGAINQANYDAMYRVMCAALGWTFFPFAQLLHDREQAQRVQTALETAKRCRLAGTLAVA